MTDHSLLALSDPLKQISFRNVNHRKHLTELKYVKMQGYQFTQENVCYTTLGFQGFVGAFCHLRCLA